MRKRFVAIYSVLVVAIVLLAVLVPSCTTTPTTGTIEVRATIDGSPWTGAVQYTLTPGPGSPISGTTSVPKSFTVDPGTWTCAYVSGGPGTFVNITPSATQSVSGGGAITFTFNFKTTPTQGTIEVKTTLDGSPWTGAVQYTLTGPGISPTGTTSVPKSFSVDPGNWACAHVSGGPGTLANITPSPTQSVSAGGTITFALNFKTITPITIRIEPPEKDAEVREAEPERNLGGEPEMWVGPLVPPEGVLRHRAFVWFSLPSLPAGATIQSANLSLYHSACAGGGNATHGAFRVTAVWWEGNITWNNQPPSAAGATYEISFPVCDTGKWRSWDVTPDIDALAIGTGWVSWVIKIIPETASGRKRVVYQTKEGSPAPYLEITYIP